jgi:hypothetical protein
MRSRMYFPLTALLLVLLPSLAWSQASTDFSEMQQWVKDTEHQPNVPTGTKITMQNYQQYKQVLPLGDDQTVRRPVFLEDAA